MTAWVDLTLYWILFEVKSNVKQIWGILHEKSRISS